MVLFAEPSNPTCGFYEALGGGASTISTAEIPTGALWLEGGSSRHWHLGAGRNRIEI